MGRPATLAELSREVEMPEEKVTEALKTHFRPEFLNRIDDVIVFHELTMDEVKRIVDLFLHRVREQLESQALDLALHRYPPANRAEDAHARRQG